VGYRPIYSIKFKKNVEDLAGRDDKIKDGLAKAIPFILEKPYYKSEKVKGENAGLMRKHICANNLRIFYYIDKKNKKVTFAMLRPKNKNTYKNL
jgi:mRNA-degrading endonuclease RelE of RelBE toxin-antitoxin system